ncbi:unnamed protein product [Oikopleura dioica]|uniref:SH3 domain-containing protein n=1 Tax=Oikopleura dioica TaxID=34765 RepID=E4Y466_OIKDI|nr:unnamed protein product [Oikopleura dioica]
MATFKVDFPYKATESDELSLEVGDLIRNCVQKEDGWLEGDLNGRTGMFPDNFATKIADERKDKKPPPPAPLKPKPKTKHFEAAFKYVASNEDELSFEVGDIITFIEDIEEGWAKGEIDNGDSGLYPTNFVKAVEDTSQSSKKEERSKGRRSEDGLRRPKDNQSSTSSSSKEPALSTRSSSADLQRYKVSFDYGASNGDELSLKKDEIITITKKETLDEGWWEARNANGQFGLIPTNFLDLKNPIVKTESNDFAKKRDIIGGSVAVRPKPEKTTQFRKDIVSMPPTAFDDKPVGKPKKLSNDMVRAKPQGPGKRRPKTRLIEEQNISEFPEEIEMDPDSDDEPVNLTPKTSLKTEPRSPVAGGIAIIPNMGSLLKNPRFKNENSKAANIKPEPVTETKVTEPKTVSIDFRNNLRRVPPKSNSFKSDRPSPQEAVPVPEWQLRAEERKKRFTEHFPDGDVTAGNDSVPQEPKVVVKNDPPPIPGHNSRERIESPPPVKPSKPTHPVASKRPPSVKKDPVAQTRTKDEPSAYYEPPPAEKEPTMVDLLREIKSLKLHVEKLTKKVDEESAARKLLEVKIRSLEN